MRGCRGVVVAVSAYMGGTRGSGDVQEMSVVRGVSGMCDMCMCLAQGGVVGVGGEWVRGLGLGFANPGRTWEKWDNNNNIYLKSNIQCI